MIYRPLGRTGWNVSAIGFGAWAIGGTWGRTDDTAAMAALHRALDRGVNFFDTADVYGDGHSERLLARLRKQRPGDPFHVATKAGRRLDPHVAEGYRDLRPFIERSLQNLDVEALDLLQLHCPPTAVYTMPEVFGALDDLVKAGKLRHYGVSVERIDEALAALRFPGVQSVQIIFNLFRQRPAEVFLPAAQAAGSPCWRGCRCPAACSAANSRATAASPPTTTAASTARARPSTGVRPSRASTTSRVWPPWRSCASSCPKASAWPGSHCAGS